MRGVLRMTMMAGAAGLFVAVAPTAGRANPLGANVVGGTAAVQGQGTSQVIVNQSSQRAIINWTTFNIAPGETTQFIQPGASAVALNRVTGGLGASQIYGTITANGGVYIINPDGILFGAGAVINTGSFLATTHDIANNNFMAGINAFTIAGNPAASIVNQGTITAAKGGFAALVAPGVRNDGIIAAKLGTVALASANGFTLDFYGDSLIKLQPSDAVSAQVRDVATGQPLASLVQNTGTLKANGGSVQLTAVAARQIVDSVINSSGVVEANTVGSHAGQVIFGAATGATKPSGAPSQVVKVSGIVSAAGRKSGSKGGLVQITGEDIRLAAAKIDASGQAGGGTILIGGDTGGGAVNPAVAGLAQASLQPWPVATATTVTVDAASVIDASARTTGNGGKVVVWSNALTTFAGLIRATGGARGGNGGFVETSGQTVEFNGIRVNTSAPAGIAGLWLLDPTNLTVDGASAATISNNLTTTNVTLQTTAGGASGPAITSSGAGDIVVNAPISWTSANTLTLDAYHAIAINSPITISGPGGLNLSAAYDPVFASVLLLSFGNGANVQFTATPNVGQSLVINGQSYTLLYAMGDVQNINASSASLANNYALAKPLDASAVASWTPIGMNAAGSVVNGGNGFTGAFEGLGNTISNLTVNSPSTNSVGLFGVSSGAIRNVGLVNETINFAMPYGTSEVIVGGLAGVNMGAISGSYASGTVAVTGTVSTSGVNTGTLFLGEGGLVGLNGGAITQSYTSNTVSGPAVNAGVELSHGTFLTIGGLAGWNLSVPSAPVGPAQFINLPNFAPLSFGGTISQSHTTGQVNGGVGASDVGGLVGEDLGAIVGSYATGTVNGSTGYVGGLVGSTDQLGTGTIVQSYATGAVNGGSDPYVGAGYNPNRVGGLVGWIWGGSVTQSYATGAVTGGTSTVGGFAGSNAGTVSQSYATGTVSPSSSSWAAGGLVGYNTGSVTQSYATGVLTAAGGGTLVGGLVGQNDVGGSVTQSVWDTTTTRTLVGIGYDANPSVTSITGLNTAQLASTSNFTGWNFGATPGGVSCASGGACWVIVDADGSLNNASGAAGATRPMLLGEWSTTITSPHQLQLMALDPTASYTLANNIALSGPLSNSSGVWGPNNGAGFIPIAPSYGSEFTGTLNGQGYSISGLTIRTTNHSVSNYGLFGVIGSAGLVENLNLTTAAITGPAPAIQSGYQSFGLLVGNNYGTINNVSVAGTVNVNTNLIAGQQADVGGLAGFNGGAITNSSSTVTVTATTASSSSTGAATNVGGLVADLGQNGTISGSSAWGAVTLVDNALGASGAAGGLVGISGGTIVQSDANGAVNGGDNSALGGLVGANLGAISMSDAHGAVTGGNNSSVGGLVGLAAIGSSISVSFPSVGQITQSFASGAVTAGANSAAGGLVGQNGGTISAGGTTYTAVPGLPVSQSYAFNSVTATGAGAYVGGLIGYNSSTLTLSYATGAVTGSGAGTHVGGLIGYNDVSGSVTHAVWDTITSGTSVGIGYDANPSATNITGLATSDFANTAKFAGWNFGTTPGGSSCVGGGACWVILDADGSFNNANGAAGASRPLLLSEYSTKIRLAAQLELMALDPTANYTIVDNWPGPGFVSTAPAFIWGPNGGHFVPIEYFAGTLNGNGYTFSGLNIAPTDPSATSVGIFAYNYGTIQNFNLSNIAISANPNVGLLGQAVGVLAGTNYGTISNVTVSGTSSINGGTIAGVTAGGLVGLNGGWIFGSSSNVTVSVGGVITPSQANLAGGLVGNNGGGTIRGSKALGNVSGGAFSTVGGLVGVNSGTISDSYASGNLAGTGVNISIGGLVGTNLFGSITDSQAFGSVSAGPTGQGDLYGDSRFSSAGGMVGNNNGTISGTASVSLSSRCVAGASFSCATGAVTVGAGNAAGGLVGYNQSQGAITQAFATGSVGTAGVAYLAAGGLVGEALGTSTILRSFATGAVSAGDYSAAGGLVGGNFSCCSSGLHGIPLISDSGASGNVSIGAFGFAGGLAGTNSGTISNSVASGAVTGGGNSIVGGLVGYAGVDEGRITSTITNSSASGAVAATGPNSVVGGLVGWSDGTLASSNASGAVSATSGSYVGGLVGINLGLIQNSVTATFSTVTGTGSGNFAGGLVGGNIGLIDPSFSAGNVTSGPGSTVGGFVGANVAIQYTNGSQSIGTVSAGSAGSGFASGGAGSAVGSQVGQNYPVSGLPALPATICSSPGCGFTFFNPLLSPPATPTSSTSSSGSTLNPPIWIIIPTTTQDPGTASQPILVNLSPPTNSGGPSGGSAGGGSPGGNSPGGGSPGGSRSGAPPPPSSPGPPPGAGIGRTLSEQQFSGVPPLNETRFLPNEVVVQIQNTVPLAELERVARELGLTLITSQNLDGTERVMFRFRSVDAADIRALIRRLEQRRIIASAQPNYVFALAQGAVAPAAASELQSDPANSELANSDLASRAVLPAGDAAQYVIEKLHLGAIHQRVRGRNVTIAVIDSEIDARHPDLAGVITEQFDATSGTSHPHPHGTGMAGAIAARSRLLGIAPAVRILAVKAFDESATSAEATTYQILKGLDHAIARNVRIVNMSFAGPYDPMMTRTLKAAYDKGIVLVAAAGNAGPKSPPLYPAADASVIAVTATDSADKPFAMANRGAYIAVAAPGVDVMVPAPGASYQLTTGTSVAAAHVSGVAALLIEGKPAITPAELRAVLMRTARTISLRPNDNQTGAGLVDPVGALQALAPASAVERGAPGPTVH